MKVEAKHIGLGIFTVKVTVYDVQSTSVDYANNEATLDAGTYRSDHLRQLATQLREEAEEIDKLLAMHD